MSRRTLIAAAVALIATVAAVYLYAENRQLRRETARLEQERAALASASQAEGPWGAAAGQTDEEQDDMLAGVPRGLGGAIDSVGRPELPEEQKETRLERRQRRQAEFAARFGRLDGETEEEWRQRVLPLMGTVLARPRDNVATTRRQLEDQAGVTKEQRAQLDAAFQEAYDELIAYTDGAVADGQLSPYDLNVAGMLDYAGGLGGMLSGVEGKIGQILTPAQIQTFEQSGFEWAEYLSVSAPWERLTPPPPPPGGS